MSRAHPLSPLLFALTVLAIGFAALQGQQHLLSAAAVVMGLLSLQFKHPLWRWSALVLYPVAFLLSLLISQNTSIVEQISAATITIIALFWISARDQLVRDKFSWQSNIIEALHLGSENLNEANDASAIIQAGISMIQELEIAPNMAFTAYRQGTPYILAASGVFEKYLDRPLHPSDNDSRSVQADHWVAQEVLSLLSRDQRRCYLVAPVFGSFDVHLGLLILARPYDRSFNEEEESVIAAFCRLLGAQLGQHRAVHEAQEANELTLKSLGAALEHRDDETGGHTQRVERTSVRLARRLGWDDEQVRALRWGAYLHDLGKLAIPDSILHKPGPLTPEERKIIQTHAIMGYDMLQDLHFLPAETLDLVRYHHERWDGTGYPSGLRGQDIPETARVFTIIDVYDALTNARPYKPAWTKERALQEIRNGAGRQFDPHYVDAFVRMMGDDDSVVIVKK